MNDGWIKLHRSILDHWIWKDHTKFGWWLEMLLMANWEDKNVVVGNTLVTVKRGEMVASNSYLMEKWGVCTHTVRNFLRLLEADGMITQKAYPKYNIITICNYEKYQCNDNCKVDPNADPNADHYTDPKADHYTDPKADPNKEYKNIRSKEDIEIKEKENKDKLYFQKEKRNFFVKPSVDEVREYCEERNNGINAQTFFDFYESKGWMVGKNHMKDWKAAVRTWERQNNQQSIPQVRLGVGEYIKDGRRTYANGRATVPFDAPPRQNDNLIWDSGSKQWVPFC